jgi:hypothetical protein
MNMKTELITANDAKYTNSRMPCLCSFIPRRSRLISDALPSSSRGRSRQPAFAKASARQVKPGQSGFGAGLAQSGKNFPRVDGLFRGAKAFP